MSLGLDSESWRAISGYPNYQVSDLGRVRKTTTWRILRGSVNPTGYRTIGLTQDGKKTTHYIHHLVAAECPQP